MPGLEDIFSMIGGLGNMGGGKDPMAAFSLLNTLSQLGKGGMGGLGDLAGMMGAFSDTQNAETNEDTIDISPPKTTPFDPCRDCRLQCDRAGMDMPSYDEVKRMAEDWQRY